MFFFNLDSDIAKGIRDNQEDSALEISFRRLMKAALASTVTGIRDTVCSA